jgi:hypothetical protein
MDQNVILILLGEYVTKYHLAIDALEEANKKIATKDSELETLRNQIERREKNERNI